MGGITCETFHNDYREFDDTNNLSCAVFIQFSNFKMLFPGDLERDGWSALLKNRRFREELSGVDILVAAHHGRESGYCKEVFNHCSPRAVIISDKQIEHETQLMTSTYHQHVAANYPDGIHVTASKNRRHVLTTRRDGHIILAVDATSFTVSTTKN